MRSQEVGLGEVVRAEEGGASGQEIGGRRRGGQAEERRRQLDVAGLLGGERGEVGREGLAPEAERLQQGEVVRAEALGASAGVEGPLEGRLMSGVLAQRGGVLGEPVEIDAPRVEPGPEALDEGGRGRRAGGDAGQLPRRAGGRGQPRDVQARRRRRRLDRRRRRDR